MSINATVSPSSFLYSISAIRDEVRQLLEKGIINRQQSLYVLCEFIPPREWLYFERELEKWDYLLRDRIGDLLVGEKWESD